MAIVCHKCGTENPDNAMTCKKCRVNLELSLDHSDEVLEKREETVSIGKTLFQVRSEDYQIDQARTRSSGRIQGLLIMGVSIFVLITALIVNFIIVQVAGRNWGVLFIPILFGLIGVPYGILVFAGNSLRPTKRVICPQCSTEHKIYRQVQKYMCTNCRALLLLGDNAKLIPQLSPCSYCGRQTAITPDHGRFLCPNCGIIRESDGTNEETPSRPCPECKATLPQRAIYCTSCGNIVIGNFSQPVQGNLSLAYDQDWKIGKDATGHFYYAKALLKGVSDDLRSASDVEKIQVLMTTLAESLLSVEEAWQAAQLRSSIEALLPEIDAIYATFLEAELRILQALSPKMTSGEVALNVMKLEPHITARRRIETILGDALKSAGSIGRWDEKLVQVEMPSRIKDYKKLETETARFMAWKGQQKAL